MGGCHFGLLFVIFVGIFITVLIISGIDPWCNWQHI
jgi:hypothetical protein